MKIKNIRKHLLTLNQSEEIAFAYITKKEVEEMFTITLTYDQWRKLIQDIEYEMDEYTDDALMDFIQIRLEKEGIDV